MRALIGSVLMVSLALSSGANVSAAAPTKATSKTPPSTSKTSAVRPAAVKTAAKVAPKAKPAPVEPAEDETPEPPPNDPDRERVLRLQEALTSIVHGPVLGRLRVGMQVRDLASGRVLYERRAGTLMDPASNQKVLASATALLRLGASYRYRTEVIGPLPDGDGTVAGDLILRGTGDPSLRSDDLEELASSLVTKGVKRVDGGVLGDRRRIGADEPDSRTPLRVSRAAIEVRVRPGDKDGERPYVAVRPASDAFVVVNRATTKGRGRSRISLSLSTDGERLQVVVSGRIPKRHPGHVLRRVPPNQTLYAAVLLRSALVHAGIEVRGRAGLFAPKPAPVKMDLEARRAAERPVLMASATAGVQSGLDVVPRDEAETRLLALHQSAPLPVIMRRINKDSDNEYAERLLEMVGAEVYGGAATTAKGLRALREAMTELGIPASAYVPANGSGLGHQNRISAVAMSDLLTRLFLDPRIGPDILQSLSVGGVDGTTRNRFRGTPAAERVRSKTGTLNGKSILSGYVGDGSDILVFSIFCQGLRPRHVNSVRHAQVSAVNAMMRYARGAVGPAPGEEVAPGTDLENGDEALETESESEDGPVDAPSQPTVLDRMIERGLKTVAGPAAPVANDPHPELPIPGDAR